MSQLVHVLHAPSVGASGNEDAVSRVYEVSGSLLVTVSTGSSQLRPGSRICQTEAACGTIGWCCRGSRRDEGTAGSRRSARRGKEVRRTQRPEKNPIWSCVLTLRWRLIAQVRVELGTPRLERFSGSSRCC